MTAAVWTSRPVILAAIARRFWWASASRRFQVRESTPPDLRRSTGRPGEGVVVVVSLGGTGNANKWVLFIDT